MSKKDIVISDDKELDVSEYKKDVAEYFDGIPVVARSLVTGANNTLQKIEKALYKAPAFINAVKAMVPQTELRAVLTDEQKAQLAKGALQLMTKKDGSLLATLINPKTKRTVKQISLESVKMTPELTKAMADFSTQMQMAQIAEQMQIVQFAIEEVRQGQEFDRLAMAYSCQQKLLQTMEIEDPKLRSTMLCQLASSAEDSRNLLMFTQEANVRFISEQPESFIQKVIHGAPVKKINARMNEIRDSLCAVNMVSFAEAMAYNEMGETAAARKSLEYYATFLKKTYLEKPGLVERLDLIDPASERYWTNTLPEINKMVQSLPGTEEIELLGE